VGKHLDARTVRSAAVAAVRGAQPLAENGYKVEMLRGTVEEALLAIA
jgi:CO/xanthine dehydrogenase FAD-binding subunit